MKLLLKQKFSLEIPTDAGDDEIIEGTLAPLSKKQFKDFQLHFKKNKDLSDELKKLQKIYRRAEKDKARYKIEDEIEELNNTLSNLDTEEQTSKYRFDLSVTSNKLDRLHEIASLIGFNSLLASIIKDIEEEKGNYIPA